MGLRILGRGGRRRFSSVNREMGIPTQEKLRLKTQLIKKRTQKGQQPGPDNTSMTRQILAREGRQRRGTKERTGSTILGKTRKNSDLAASLCERDCPVTWFKRFT